MAKVRAANVAELIAVYSSTGKHVINRYHVAYGGVAPLAQTEADALAAAFSNHWRTRFLGALSDEVETVQFEANDIDPNGFAAGLDSTTDPGAGAAQAAPMNATMCISWRTEAPRYRGGHPRMYLSGLTYNLVVTGGLWASGTVTAIQTAAIGFIGDLNGMTFGTGPRSVTFIDLAVYRDKVKLATPQQWPIVGARANPQICTQRRRTSAA